MVLRTIGPRITGPWDLGCLGSKVRGPKVRGSKALGLIILEPLLPALHHLLLLHFATHSEEFYYNINTSQLLFKTTF